MVRNDREGLDTCAGQLACLNRFFLHQEPEVGGRAESPAIAGLHEVHTFAFVPFTKVGQGFGDLATVRQAVRYLLAGHRFGDGKKDRFDHALLFGHRWRFEQGFDV